MNLENEPLLATEKSKQWPQFLAAISGGILAIGSGVHIGWSSPSVLKMQSNDLGFDITNEEISYIVMVGPLGYLIGSPISGFLLDRLGRKNSLLVLAIPQIIAWLLIATANCVPMLCLARLITGIADGALFTTLPVYVCEVVEPNVRGIIGTCHTMGIIIGNLLINVYGSFLSIRSTACLSLMIPLLFLLTFWWMPDSPYFLLVQGHVEEARKALKSLRRIRNVEAELSDIASDVQRQISEPGRMQDIFFIGSNRKAFMILIGLRTFQQLSGMSALCFYTQVVFQEAGGSFTPAESAIICTGMEVIFTCFTSCVIDKFGRKPLLIVSSIGSAVLLIVIGFYLFFQQKGFDVSSFSWLPVVAMILYYIVCAGGLVLVPNLMTGELLSVSVKSKALGLINMYLGLGMGISSKMFHFLGYNFGMYMAFFVFGTCCLFSAIFCYFVVPETKGKTLEQIQQIIKGNCENRSADIKENGCNNTSNATKI